MENNTASNTTNQEANQETEALAKQEETPKVKKRRLPPAATEEEATIHAPLYSDNDGDSGGSCFYRASEEPRPVRKKQPKAKAQKPVTIHREMESPLTREEKADIILHLLVMAAAVICGIVLIVAMIMIFKLIG